MKIWITSDGAVRFPGLQWGIEHLREGIEIFGITVSFSGILLAVALILGLWIAERLAKKTEQNTEFYLDLAIRVVIGGVLGARLTYVIYHWNYYKEQPAEMFALHQDEMSFLGALVTGLAIAFWYCKKRKVSWLKTCDTAMLGIVAGQILGKAGDFFSRTNLGTYSEGTLAMQIAVQDLDADTIDYVQNSRMMQGDYIQVHPVFLYEIIGLVFLLLLLLFVFKKQKISGLVLGVYLIGYGILHFASECVRMNTVRAVGSISVEQVLAAAAVCTGGFIVANGAKRQHKILKNLPKNFLRRSE